MTADHRFLSDNPSLETQVALVVQALDTFISNDRDWKERMEKKTDALVQQVTTQNGNVARLTGRANDHDGWHGRNDERTLTRVGQMWDEREAAQIRKGVYLSAWKVIAWVIGVAGTFGIGGLLIGRFA